MFPFLLTLSLTFHMALAANPKASLKIQNLNDLEKCYLTNATESEIKNQVGHHCTEKAVQLAGSEHSNVQLLLELAESVRKNDRQESSLKIFTVLVAHDKTLKSCENSEAYSALKAALAHPTDYPSTVDSDVKNSFAYMEICIKKSDFLNDIKDDVETDNKYVKKNLCDFFKSKKIKSKCP